MDICIFYSWQSQYDNNCNKIIYKAIEKAVKELNKEMPAYRYFIKRGGGDVVGEEDITDNIDKIIRQEADIAIVDFTHIGCIPHRNPNTGEWVKEKCLPNANAVNEHGKLVIWLDERQVFKVYNTAYGEIDVNLEPPFDFRQKHYPVSFFCNDAKTEEERAQIKDDLTRSIKARIKECTEVFLENQKVRYAPLVPMRNEFSKRMYSIPFKTSEAYAKVRGMVEAGQSFRLLGLPGLGKTRMVGEALRGRENDVYYCDCKDQPNVRVIEAVDKLFHHRGSEKQVVILDNCNQRLCGSVNDLIIENAYNCQLISIHYDPKEHVDSGINAVPLKVNDFKGVVEDIVEQVKDMPDDVKKSIVGFSGGFPLMATVMIENYNNGLSIVNITKKDLFERMMGINTNNPSDLEKLKVLTAFSIFKFIGLYGNQEKQGRFIANNRIITGIYHGTENDNLQLFKEVYGRYQNGEILERQGNLVLMRLIPLAIYLCKDWYDRQTPDSIGELIEQIRSLDDEGTKNMLIESLSRRIVLLSDVPLAKELNNGLTDPDHSPFLIEEVVLSALGSRIFLAFSEVNPESCAYALHRMIERKDDDEIRRLEPARRNLAWALDHLAFDKRSFRYSMLTLARFSLVETEDYLSNNTTGLFVDRFSIVLSGTEVDLMTRLDILKELSKDGRYRELIKKALRKALLLGHFYRAGGAEKQGTRKLKDYMPSFNEVIAFFNASFDMLVDMLDTPKDLDELSKTIAGNAREYYIQGVDTFLFKALGIIAKKKSYVWEEMRDVLTSILDFDVKRKNMYRSDELEAWKSKLTKDDYVFSLLHAGKEIMRSHRGSYIDEMKKVSLRYEELARELIDKDLFKDEEIMNGVMTGQCSHYNSYGMELSKYSLKKEVQTDIMGILLEWVLNKEVSKDAESMFLFFLDKVEDRRLIETAYKKIRGSEKKHMLPAMFAVKAEDKNRLDDLFLMLDKGELSIKDFSGYFNYLYLNKADVKYVVGKLLDYGAEGAELILSHCHHLLFDNDELDSEYDELVRKCLLLVSLKGVQLDDFLFMNGMESYLDKHHDEEMALHIHNLQESYYKQYPLRDNYYLGRLYKKVLKTYPDLLKPKLFALLEDKTVRHSWMELMKTSFPQDDGDANAIYTLIPTEEWFEWLIGPNINERAYTLAMFFNYSNKGLADPVLLQLIDSYWCDDIRCALSSRFHSFCWSGSAIPLYESRINLCKDYADKTSNEYAREWFTKEIDRWKGEIQREQIEDAHERAIYD